MQANANRLKTLQEMKTEIMQEAREAEQQEKRESDETGLKQMPLQGKQFETEYVEELKDFCKEVDQAFFELKKLHQQVERLKNRGKPVMQAQKMPLQFKNKKKK